MSVEEYYLEFNMLQQSVTKTARALYATVTWLATDKSSNYQHSAVTAISDSVPYGDGVRPQLTVTTDHVTNDINWQQPKWSEWSPGAKATASDTSQYSLYFNWPWGKLRFLRMNLWTSLYPSWYDLIFACYLVNVEYRLAFFALPIFENSRVESHTV